MAVKVCYQATSSWVSAGLDYALRSWTCTFNRMGSNNLYKRIERIALGIVAEKAFVQFLNDNGIMHSQQGKTRWYEEDRYDISVGDYAIDVKSNILDITLKKIEKDYSIIQKSPEIWFDNCIALVPLDQFNPGKSNKRKHDLKGKAYVFPFIYPNINSSVDEKFIHAFWDYNWLKKGEYKDTNKVGFLTCENTGDNNVVLRIFGTSKKNTIQTESIVLPGKSEIKTTKEYFQVFSISLTDEKLPDGVIKIKPNNYRNLIEIISPEVSHNFKNNDDVVNNWYKINLPTINVFFAGWIKEDYFRLVGRKFPRFSHNIKQYSEIQVDNWGTEVKNTYKMLSIKKLM